MNKKAQRTDENASKTNLSSIVSQSIMPSYIGLVDYKLEQYLHAAESATKQ
jgi:hypothetical protein